MSNRWLAMLVLVLGCKQVLPAEEFLEADQLVARDPATLADTPLRVHGFVKRGTIGKQMRAGTSLLSFTVVNRDKGIPVIYPGPPPDKFQDQAEVIVRGTLVPAESPGSGYVIQATELLAKCPTNYDRGKGPAPAQYQ